MRLNTLLVVIGLQVYLSTKVLCQDAFPVTVTITPVNDPGNIAVPGEPVNMTCQFQLIAGRTLGNLHWQPKEKYVIANFDGTNTITPGEGVSDTEYGYFLSTDPNIMSYHWIIFTGTLCDESRLVTVGDYNCFVTDSGLASGSGQEPLKYRDPQHEIKVNDVTHEGSLNLEDTDIGKPQTFSCSTEEQRDAVVAMTMKINGEDVPDTTFTNSSDTLRCSHSASMEKDVTFDSPGVYTITFEVNDNALTCRLTVTVEDTDGGKFEEIIKNKEKQ